ncbi:MAG TPA: FAD-binding protein, partial [Bryobacteraceae bacterium]|nr:FAD-binding protein [Bryobacteraceae bacterium]
MITSYLSDASGYKGHAERLFVPENESELSAILRDASAQRIPLTISGAGTGLAGGRVAQGGWVISMEKFRRLEIGDGVAWAGAAVSLMALRDAALPT